MLVKKIRKVLFSADIVHFTVFVANIRDLMARFDKYCNIKKIVIFHLDEENIDMSLIDNLAKRWPKEYYYFGNSIKQKQEILYRIRNQEICSIAILDNEIVHFQWVGFRNNFMVNPYAKVLQLTETDAIWYNWYTFPAHRGKGIIYVVASDILKYIYKKNKRRIFACVGGKNVASYVIHAKCFELYGTLYYVKLSAWHRYILKRHGKNRLH